MFSNRFWNYSFLPRSKNYSPTDFSTNSWQFLFLFTISFGWKRSHIPHGSIRPVARLPVGNLFESWNWRKFWSSPGRVVHWLWPEWERNRYATFSKCTCTKMNITPVKKQLKNDYRTGRIRPCHFFLFPHKIKTKVRECCESSWLGQGKLNGQLYVTKGNAV